MRELMLNADGVKIKINNQDYEILLTDAEIMAKVQEVSDLCKAVNAGNANEMMTIAKELASAIDCIIGQGAVSKISGGKPVGVRMLIRWLKQIGDQAIGAHLDKLIEDND